MSGRQQKIKEVLERGVENIYPSTEAFAKALASPKKLKIYNGIDPTGQLHIGHGVVLLKLRQLQELGHEITLLIGDFTAQIGDPTDKTATRQPLTPAQIKKNAAGYKKLIGKILDLKKTKFVGNASWTQKLKPADLLGLASHLTVAQLLERDMFQARIKAGREIHLHEFLYPLFQGYDSVVLDTDMEVGGNDQTFNMLVGRTLMKKIKNKEKFVLTTKLLVDPTGKKMGKSEGNMANLDDKPENMYGKIMSWPDSIIGPAFEIATAVPFAEVKQIQSELKTSSNPKQFKMKLARRIVDLYHGAKAAEKAEAHFQKVFSQKQQPDDIREVSVSSRGIVNVLVETRLAGSRSEARRLLTQGGIKMDNLTIRDEDATVAPGAVLQKGKRHFVKIK